MRKGAGYIVFGVAALVALFALFTVVDDVIRAAHMQPASPDEAVSRMASFVLGLITNTLVSAGVALLLFLWGRSLVNPAKYSKGAIYAERLRRIYASENLQHRSFPSAVDELDYGGKPDADLDHIYHSIDRKTVPLRLEALLAAIKARVEAVPAEGQKQADD